MGSLKHQQFFEVEFDFSKRSNINQAILSTYYAFTTLSTVGFGDYHPWSEEERILCAFVLMWGVSIFSYIMGTFIQIIEDQRILENDLDDGDNLSRFISVLTNYNYRKPLNKKFKKKLETYFKYKWNNDPL